MAKDFREVQRIREQIEKLKKYRSPNKRHNIILMVPSSSLSNDEIICDGCNANMAELQLIPCVASRLGSEITISRAECPTCVKRYKHLAIVGICPSCKNHYKMQYLTKEEAFATQDLGEREFWLSGLCPNCQKGVFDDRSEEVE